MPPVPAYPHFIEPVLRFLANRPDGVATPEVYPAMVEALQLTPEDCSELLQTGQPVYKNRAGWAYDRLKRSGLGNYGNTGHWELSEHGVLFARENPSPLQQHVILAIANQYDEFRSRLLGEENIQEAQAELSTDNQSTISPDDRLEIAVRELRSAAGDELLTVLSRISPERFEVIVLDLLYKLGYGSSRSDLLQTRRSGDGGIDGVISLDRLGLEKVYVQAKRWQNSVGEPELRDFYGALAGQGAKKGVFITTSKFSQPAEIYASSLGQFVLINGSRLVDLMIEHEVGVTSRIVCVPKIDSDYFEE